MSVRTDVINLQVNINGNNAQNRLNELKKRAADLTLEMSGLRKGTADYIAKSKELAQVKNEMDGLKKTIGLTALSQKELVQELNKLKALRGSAVPFSKEFRDFDDQIKKVEKRLYDVRNGVQGFSSFWSRINDQVKQFGVLAAGYLGFQFISSQFTNILTGAGKLSDQLADLRRVAGLTAEEAKTLNSQLGQLDSRTSTQGLREIAIIAGKLGVAKGDIFEFTKAVDQLVVALGDELGNADQITEQLGKILNVFEGNVNGDNITRLGNAFVELANAGVASGGFIAQFDQMLAGVAKSAGIGLGELSGLGAGLEELGARVESSATAIQKLIISISSDIPKAAKIAGMATDDFQRLYDSNATEALLRYSEGLVKNKASFTEVTQALAAAGEEGARTVETISKLGQSSDLLRQKISLGAKAFQESGAITEAFQLKNETLGATIDKLGKDFNRLVTSSAVTEFIKSLVESFSKLVNTLVNIPAPVFKLTFAIVSLVAGVALYNSAMIQSARASLAMAAATIRNTIVINAKAAAIILSRIATQGMITAQAAYIVVTSALTGRITAATAAQKLFTIALRTPLGPIGLLVTAVGGLLLTIDKIADAFKSTNKETEIYAETLRMANDEIGKQKSEIDSYTKIVTDNNVSLNTRKEYLQKLIDISPEYLGRLTLENIATDEGKRILDNYNQSLQANANLKAASDIKDKQFSNVVRLRSLKQELEIAQSLGKGYGDLNDELRDLFSRVTTSVGRTRNISEIFNADISESDFAEAYKEIDKQIRAAEETSTAATNNFVKQQKQKDEARQKFLLTELQAAHKELRSLKQGTEAYEAANKKYEDLRRKYYESIGIVSSGKKMQAENDLNATVGLIEKLQAKIKELDDARPKLTSEAEIKKNLAERKKLQEELDRLEGRQKPEKLENLKKDYEEFLRDLENLKKRTEGGKSPEDEEIRQVNEKYQKLNQRAQEFFKKQISDQIAFTNQKKLLTEQEQKEINAIYKKYMEKRFQESSEKEYEDALAARADFSEKLKRILAEQYRDGIITKQDYETGVTEIESDETDDRIIIAGDYSKTVKKAAEDMVKFRQAKEKETTANIVSETDKRISIEKRNEDAAIARRILTAREGSRERLNWQIKELELQMARELENTTLTEEERLLIILKYREKIDELSDQQAIAEIDRVRSYLQAGLDVINELDNFVSARENRQLSREKALNDKKKKAYKEQLDAKLLSQAQYDKKVAALEAQQEEREKQIKKRQAERQKKINLFETFINTAAAVAKYLYNPGGPEGWALSIAAGIKGGLQLAAIASAEEPSFGQGDWVRKGDKHSAPSGGINAKIERDEAVIKAAAMTSRNVYTVTGTTAQITSKLNSMAGGKSWADGAVIEKPRWFKEASYIRPKVVQMMADGGYNGTAKAMASNPSADETNQLLRTLIVNMGQYQSEIQNMKMRIKADVVLRDIQDADNLLNESRKAASIAS